MSDSVGKITLDLEVQSDIAKQVEAVSDRIGKGMKGRLQNILKSNLSFMKRDTDSSIKYVKDKLTSGMKDAANKSGASAQNAAKSTADMIKGTFSNAGNTAKKVIERIQERTHHMVQGMLKMAKLKETPSSTPRVSEDTAPKVKTTISKAASPRAPPSLDLELVKSQMETIEKTMDTIERSISSHKTKLKGLRESYEQAFNPKVKDNLSAKMLKEESSINSLIGKMDTLAGKYDKLESKLRAFHRARSAAPAMSGGVAETAAPTTSVAATAAGGALASASGGAVSKVKGMLASIKQFVSGSKKVPSLLKGIANGFKSVGNHSKRASVNVHSFGGGLKNTLGQMMKWMIILPAIASGIKAFASNLFACLKTNSQFNSSLKQIQANLWTAFMPIYNAILPAINTLMAALARLSAYLASFLNGLFGKTYSSGLDAAKGLIEAKNAAGAYGGSAAKAAKSSKELQNSLSGIDELNRLNGSSDAGGGGGGGGVGPELVTPPDMSAVDAATIPWVEKFRDILSRLFQPFQQSWAAEGLNTINALKSSLSSVWELVKAIGKSFLDVWTNGTGTRVLSTILQIFQDIFAIIGNIADRIREAWDANGNGERIIQGLFNLFQAVLDIIKKIGDATVEWAEKIDFEPLLESVADVISSLEPVVRTVGDVLSDIWQNVALPFVSWLIETAVPNVLELLANLFDFLGEHEWIIKALIVGVTTFIAAFSGVSTIFGIIDGLSGVFTTLAGVFSTIKTGAMVVAGAIGGISTPVLVVVGVLAALVAGGVLLYKNWDTIKEKATEIWNAVQAKFEIFRDFLSNVFTVDWSKNFGIIGDVMNALLANVKNIWDSVKLVFTGVVDFLSGVFSGNWKKAWDGITQIFKGIVDGWGAVMKAPLNIIISLINGAIDQINKIHVDIPDFVPGIGGKSFGVSIPKLSYLAHGGIVDQPTLAMMGEQGKSEAVVPLERNLGWRDAIADKITEELQTGAGRDYSLDELIARLREVIMEAVKLFAGLIPQPAQYQADTGDIIIPIYLDNGVLDEIIITAQQRRALRSGGK